MIEVNMIKKTAKTVYSLLTYLKQELLGRRRFKKDFQHYNEMEKPKQFFIQKKNLYPIYIDWFKNAGEIDPHYFLQDIWTARQIFKDHPQQHYDIGSRIDGFIAHCLAFNQDITLIDIRPLPYSVKGLKFIQADATDLKEIADNSLESISSLHAVEHFGLGRYGDPIDPYACFKAMKAMQRVLKPGGKLYFGVPIGNQEKVCFNAHRIFSPLTIIRTFDLMTLKEFVYIDNMQIKTVSLKNIENCNIGSYCCGIFIFEKC